MFSGERLGSTSMKAACGTSMHGDSISPSSTAGGRCWSSQLAHIQPKRSSNLRPATKREGVYIPKPCPGTPSLLFMVTVVLVVSTSGCDPDSMGSNPIGHPNQYENWKNRIRHISWPRYLVKYEKETFLCSHEFC